MTRPGAWLGPSPRQRARTPGEASSLARHATAMGAGRPNGPFGSAREAWRSFVKEFPTAPATLLALSVPLFGVIGSKLWDRLTDEDRGVETRAPVERVEPKAWLRPDQPLTPRGSPAAWVTVGDYPAEALRNELTGRVAFDLNVGTDGRPLRCRVTRSSGHAALDERTCAVITRRARFDPATGPDGRPIEARYANQVLWQIPG